MKRQIRTNVWETNSSSTHTCYITTQDMYDEWIENDRYLFDGSSYAFDEGHKPKCGKIYAKNEVKEFITKYYQYFDSEDNLEDEDVWREIIGDAGFCMYEQFCDDDYLEFFEERYTTPGGEHVVAFGKFGYDG